MQATGPFAEGTVLLSGRNVRRNFQLVTYPIIKFSLVRLIEL